MTSAVGNTISPKVKPAQAVQLLRLAALTDKVRRNVYEFVAGRYPDQVDKDQVAAATGISRSLAAFHLDRLAGDELVTASFARRSGRSGPGAGRPAKYYRRVTTEVAVSVPERRYKFAARLLIQAVNDSRTRDTAVATGRAEGHRIGERARANGLSLVAALEDGGFEPLAGDDAIELRNCPFAELTDGVSPLVCGMTTAMVAGIADELGVDVKVREDHRPGVCCVVVDPAL